MRSPIIINYKKAVDGEARGSGAGRGGRGGKGSINLTRRRRRKASSRVKRLSPTCPLSWPAKFSNSLGGMVALNWEHYDPVPLPMQSEWNSIPRGHAPTQLQRECLEHVRACVEWYGLAPDDLEQGSALAETIASRGPHATYRAASISRGGRFLAASPKYHRAYNSATEQAIAVASSNFPKPYWDRTLLRDHAGRLDFYKSPLACGVLGVRKQSNLKTEVGLFFVRKKDPRWIRLVDARQVNLLHRDVTIAPPPVTLGSVEAMSSINLAELDVPVAGMGDVCEIPSLSCNVLTCVMDSTNYGMRKWLLGLEFLNVSPLALWECSHVIQWMESMLNIWSRMNLCILLSRLRRLWVGAGLCGSATTLALRHVLPCQALVYKEWCMINVLHLSLDKAPGPPPSPR
eukprot:5663460-Amphidinium_carterae.2